MKNKKLWGGRFQAETLSEVDQFNASVNFDRALYPYDIAGSLAHVKMLGKCGLLKASEVKKITSGLKKIHREIEEGKFRWDIAKEDVHLNIESELIKYIGEVGGKLHTARSRNDQVATDFRLFCRDQVERIADGIRKLQFALIEQAETHIDTLLPGYTHMQRAQPISLAHYLLAYFEMLQRDWERLKDCHQRINSLPLGAGALAGTTFPIDREFVARELGFSSVAHNSLDAVSDRDFALEMLSTFSILMMHLSRLSEEWILWATQEFQFIQLPEGFCTGSSMMPQKMNPDVLELIRGKTGRVYGSLLAMLTVMKSLPLSYNKDMQEDKEPLFDAVVTVTQCLSVLAALVQKTHFNVDQMKKALGKGFVLATDLADYLALKGVPFRQAHRIVGQVVAHCQKLCLELKDLSLDDLKKFDPHFGADAFDWLDEGHAVDRRRSLGGTARFNVGKEIKRAKKILKDRKESSSALFHL